MLVKMLRDRGEGERKGSLSVGTNSGALFSGEVQ